MAKLKQRNPYYYINFGYVNTPFISEDIISKIIKSKNEDEKNISSIGVDKFVNINFDKLSDPKCTLESKRNIVHNYNVIIDETYRNSEINEEKWVSDYLYNEDVGYCGRLFTSKDIENIKRLNGGKNFFKSIKDEYREINSYPKQELSFINTNNFVKYLEILGDNIKDKETILKNKILPKTIDQIKWLYFWGFKTISKYKNNSVLLFRKN